MSAAHIWAASWQNQQNGMCAQRGLGSAWASTQFDPVSSLSAWRKLEYLATHWAHSDQTGWMPRLIWVFDGCTFCWFYHEAAHNVPLAHFNTARWQILPDTCIWLMHFSVLKRYAELSSVLGAVLAHLTQRLAMWTYSIARVSHQSVLVIHTLKLEYIWPVGQSRSYFICSTTAALGFRAGQA